MKLGIKTTDGVSKLKTKTTDGVAKAVECACCDPCPSLWGPGYDTQPETIDVLGWPIVRTEACRWELTECLCSDGNDNFWWTFLPVCGGYEYVDEYFQRWAGCQNMGRRACNISFNTYFNEGYLSIYGPPPGAPEEDEGIYGDYLYRADSGKFPYGVYDNRQSNSADGPPTITIAPPAP